MRLLTFLIVACSMDAVLNAECDVGCRWAGYDAGCMAKPETKCLCVETKDAEQITRTKRIVLPASSKKQQPVIIFAE